MNQLFKDAINKVFEESIEKRKKRNSKNIKRSVHFLVNHFGFNKQEETKELTKIYNKNMEN